MHQFQQNILRLIQYWLKVIWVMETMLLKSVFDALLIYTLADLMFNGLQCICIAFQFA